MAIIRCEKGHIYNSDQFESCPTCISMGYRIDFGGRGSITEALNNNVFEDRGSGIASVGRTVGVGGIFGGGATGDVEIEEVGVTIAAGLNNANVAKNAQRPVTGWLVCIQGANAGRAFELHSDYNYIGSEKGDVVIPGDKKISREKHMMITYDSQDRKFYISPASGANIIRVNDKALIGDGRELNDYDSIRTGDSVFLFVSFCSEKFDWEDLGQA